MREEITASCASPTCMEEPEGEQLLQVALHGALGEQLPVDSHAVQLSRAIDFGARSILHCQHILGCVRPQNLGHLHGKPY